MKHASDSIRRSAVEIERLRGRVHELVVFRSRSPADRDAWAAACAQFHKAFEELSFPGGNAQWQGFVEGEAASFEVAGDSESATCALLAVRAVTDAIDLWFSRHCD